MLNRAKRGIGYLTTGVVFVAQLFICGLVILVAFSAIARYLFSKPVFFVEEVGGLCFMGLAFLSFPYVFATGRHVNLTLVTNSLPETLRNWVEVVQYLLLLVFLIVFVKVSWDFVYISYQLGCHTADTHLYEVPWQAIMPGSMIVFAIAVSIFLIDKTHGVIFSSHRL